jgi:hypothetical protein
MKKTKVVLKSTILKAIKVEPLKGGSWLYERDTSNPNCPVCAVGATLRQIGFDNDQITDFGSAMVDYGHCCNSDSFDTFAAATELKEHLKARNYLHALSMKFEYLYSRLGGGKRTRKTLTKFVKENFPKRIPLNPAR